MSGGGGSTGDGWGGSARAPTTNPLSDWGYQGFSTPFDNSQAPFWAGSEYTGPGGVFSQYDPSGPAPLPTFDTQFGITPAQPGDASTIGTFDPEGTYTPPSGSWTQQQIESAPFLQTFGPNNYTFDDWETGGVGGLDTSTITPGSPLTPDYEGTFSELYPYWNRVRDWGVPGDPVFSEELLRRPTQSPYALGSSFQEQEYPSGSGGLNPATYGSDPITDIRAHTAQQLGLAAPVLGHYPQAGQYAATRSQQIEGDPTGSYSYDVRQAEDPLGSLIDWPGQATTIGGAGYPTHGNIPQLYADIAEATGLEGFDWKHYADTNVANPDFSGLLGDMTGFTGEQSWADWVLGSLAGSQGIPATRTWQETPWAIDTQAEALSHYYNTGRHDPNMQGIRFLGPAPDPVGGGLAASLPGFGLQSPFYTGGTSGGVPELSRLENPYLTSMEAQIFGKYAYEPFYADHPEVAWDPNPSNLRPNPEGILDNPEPWETPPTTGGGGWSTTGDTIGQGLAGLATLDYAQAHAQSQQAIQTAYDEIYNQGIFPSVFTGTGIPMDYGNSMLSTLTYGMGLSPSPYELSLGAFSLADVVGDATPWSPEWNAAVQAADTNVNGIDYSLSPIHLGFGGEGANIGFSNLSPPTVSDFNWNNAVVDPLSGTPIDQLDDAQMARLNAIIGSPGQVDWNEQNTAWFNRPFNFPPNSTPAEGWGGFETFSEEGWDYVNSQPWALDAYHPSSNLFSSLFGPDVVPGVNTTMPYGLTSLWEGEVFARDATGRNYLATVGDRATGDWLKEGDRALDRESDPIGLRDLRNLLELPEGDINKITAQEYVDASRQVVPDIVSTGPVPTDSVRPGGAPSNMWRQQYSGGFHADPVYVPEPVFMPEGAGFIDGDGVFRESATPESVLGQGSESVYSSSNFFNQENPFFNNSDLPFVNSRTRTRPRGGPRGGSGQGSAGAPTPGFTPDHFMSSFDARAPLGGEDRFGPAFFSDMGLNDYGNEYLLQRLGSRHGINPFGDSPTTIDGNPFGGPYAESLPIYGAEGSLILPGLRPNPQDLYSQTSYPGSTQPSYLSLNPLTDLYEIPQLVMGARDQRPGGYVFPPGSTGLEGLGNILGVADGGVPSINAHGSTEPSADLIDMTVASLLGEVRDPKKVISEFLKKYGAEALKELADNVADGGDGSFLRGPGDGRADDIPGLIDGSSPVMLSSNEYVVPADVVKNIGSGSVNAGAGRLMSMVDDVRAATNGRHGGSSPV